LRRSWLAMIGAVLTTACAFPLANGDSARADLARDSTDIAVLSYNVKALPYPLGGWRKGERLRAVRAGFRDYDLVLLQEAFTAHDDLLGGLESRGVVTSEHFGPARTGDGLTRSTGLAIATFRPLGATPVRHVGHYNLCSGHVGRANDCLASKGFMLQRVRFRDAEIDVYDTHLDADPRDQPTRERQLATLSAEIQRLSATRPLIVAGDFNIDRSDSAQFAALHRFAATLGLRDSNAIQGASWPERLDYIFVRSSDDVTVEVVRAGSDSRFRTATHELSDHPAMFAILRVTRAGAARNAR
jgi:endonuclease/exonuclease/phosphatase family metal-dependent hydrolase